MATLTATDSPRIYVASLSDYNGGVLHGEWIDVEGRSVDDIRDDIARMLDTSEYNACVTCGHGKMRHDEIAAELTEETGAHDYAHSVYGPAEEWAIHDYDAFYGFRIGEFTSIEDVVRIADGITAAQQYPDALGEWVSNQGGDLDAIDTFEDGFRGVYDSGADYAREMFIESWQCSGKGDPSGEDWFSYMDWDAFWRGQYDCAGYWTSRTGDGSVYVFEGV